MKKLLALALVLVFCLTFTACGQNDAEKFIEEQGEKFVSELESSVAMALPGSDAELRAEGEGLVIDFKVATINNATEEQKQAIQANSSGSISYFETALADLQKDYPGIEFLKINFCESDGDLLVSLTAD